MLVNNVVLADGAKVTHPDLVSLSDCVIGSGSRIGPFVEILGGTVIGAHCKISSHSTLCCNVHVGDGVFVGHGVVIAPIKTLAVNVEAEPLAPATTVIGRRAAIGSRATIKAGCRIGENALIGAGAVVLDDVPAGAVVAGNPAVIVGTGRAVQELRSREASRQAEAHVPTLEHQHAG